MIAESQLARLAGLGRRVEQSNGGSLTSIRAEVNAFVAATQATALQARSAAATAQAAEMAVHAAQAEARRVTGDFVHDFYERKVFDPYLRFASEDEEKAYREREEARRQQIEAARAEGTPEGDARALDLAKDQLLDAGQHGADRSPDYEPMLNDLTAAQQNLRAAQAPQAKAEVDSALDEPASVGEAQFVSPDIIASLRRAGVATAASTSPPPPDVRQSQTITVS